MHAQRRGRGPSDRPRSTAWRGDAGFALPAVIAVLVLLGIMTLGAWMSAGDDFAASVGTRETTRSRLAAEAGANVILANWRVQQYDTLMPNSGDSVNLGWMTLPHNGGQFAARLQRIDNGGLKIFTLRVTGRNRAGPGERRTVKVSVTETIGDTLFRWAAFGEEYLELNKTDAYGPIGSNGDIEFKGDSHLWGEATATGTITSTSDVTGTAIEGGTPVPLGDVPCPVGPYGPAPIGPGVEFNAANGELKIDGDVDTSFPEGVYYYTLVKHGGNGRIRIAAGDFVQIYVDGEVSIDGTNGIDNPNSSANLQIIGCGADASSWQFTGVLNVLTVYAIRHDVKLKGPAAYTGSFIGREVKKETAGDLKYDPTLSGGGGGGLPTRIIAGSWTELAR